MTSPLPSPSADRQVASEASQGFAGFEPLNANYIYTPNQFLDLCLPYCSRGVVRLVGYMLRRTLGWLDSSGEPIEQDIAVPYRELINEARISRGAIRPALDEAVKAGFLVCTQAGRAKRQGVPGEIGAFRLRWDDRRSYQQQLDEFRGFYTGEGHRTPIPNAFFDRILSNESLAVSKVVGTVLRHTVGYQNQFGGRLDCAALSYSHIQRYANLKDRATLSGAIQHAIEVGYVKRIKEGCFSPHVQARRAATYAVKWLHEAKNSAVSSKPQPISQGQFKNPTNNGSEAQPSDQFKSPTTRKTQRKDTCKNKQMLTRGEGSRKQTDDEVVAVKYGDVVTILEKAGFDTKTATRLAGVSSYDEVSRQIEWLPLRGTARNSLGMLRKAIEERWEAPASANSSLTSSQIRDREALRRKKEAEVEAARQREERERQRLRRRQIALWRSLSDDKKRELVAKAADQSRSDFTRARLNTLRDLSHPPAEVLMLLPSDSEAVNREICSITSPSE